MLHPEKRALAEHVNVFDHQMDFEAARVLLLPSLIELRDGFTLHYKKTVKLIPNP